MSHSKQENEIKNTQYDPAPVIQAWQAANKAGIVTSAIITETQFALSVMHGNGMDYAQYVQNLGELYLSDSTKLVSSDEIEAAQETKKGLDTIIRKTVFDNAFKILTTTPHQANCAHVGEAIYVGTQMVTRGAITAKEMQDNFSKIHATPLPEAMSRFRDNMLKTHGADVGYDMSSTASNSGAYKYN